MGLYEQVEDGEIVEDVSEPAKEMENKDGDMDEGARNLTPTLSERKPFNWSRIDNNQRLSRMVFKVPLAEHIPRVLPKNEDPSLVNSNKRMLGQFLGTMEWHRFIELLLKYRRRLPYWLNTGKKDGSRI